MIDSRTCDKTYGPWHARDDQAGKVRGTIPSDYETPYQIRRESLGCSMSSQFERQTTIKTSGLKALRQESLILKIEGILLKQPSP